MNIKELLNKVKSNPTMMDIESEILIIKNLQIIDYKEIEYNKEELFEILELLETSHSQSIFQVNESNLKIFKDFGLWVRGLKNYFKNEAIKLEIIAENLEATFF